MAKPKSSSHISDIAPFHMLGNVYFVGSTAVSVHIIDTGDGLIMIDTGYPIMREQILYSMRSLGLDPADLRIILLSHGHYDHTGCVLDFKAMSGAKVYIGRPDNDIINGTRDLSWATELGYERLPDFDADVLLDDGDTVELGNTCIRCVMAPGHTEGTLAMFFETEHEGKRYTCAMHGGVGVNSLVPSFLNKYDLPRSLPDTFRSGLKKLAEMHVDVVLGNHPCQNDTEGKLARILAGESDACIDPAEWSRFLEESAIALDKAIQNDGK